VSQQMGIKAERIQKLARELTELFQGYSHAEVILAVEAVQEAYLMTAIRKHVCMADIEEVKSC
jgi:hypothetical protein